MIQSQPSTRLAKQRAVLKVFNPPSQVAGSDRWRIDGHPARILIWSVDEWERLENQPADAQFHPFGVWCALRVE